MKKGDIKMKKGDKNICKITEGKCLNSCGGDSVFGVKNFLGSGETDNQSSDTSDTKKYLPDLSVFSDAGREEVKQVLADLENGLDGEIGTCDKCIYGVNSLVETLKDGINMIEEDIMFVEKQEGEENDNDNDVDHVVDKMRDRISELKDLKNLNNTSGNASYYIKQADPCFQAYS